jgi:hypothetical protein
VPWTRSRGIVLRCLVPSRVAISWNSRFIVASTRTTTTQRKYHIPCTNHISQYPHIVSQSIYQYSYHSNPFFPCWLHASPDCSVSAFQLPHLSFILLAIMYSNYIPHPSSIIPIQHRPAHSTLLPSLESESQRDFDWGPNSAVAAQPTAPANDAPSSPINFLDMALLGDEDDEEDNVPDAPIMTVAPVALHQSLSAHSVTTTRQAPATSGEIPQEADEAPPSPAVNFLDELFDEESDDEQDAASQPIVPAEDEPSSPGPNFMDTALWGGGSDSDGDATPAPTPAAPPVAYHPSTAAASRRITANAATTTYGKSSTLGAILERHVGQRHATTVPLALPGSRTLSHGIRPQRSALLPKHATATTMPPSRPSSRTPVGIPIIASSSSLSPSPTTESPPAMSKKALGKRRAVNIPEKPFSVPEEEGICAEEIHTIAAAKQRSLQKTRGVAPSWTAPPLMPYAPSSSSVYANQVYNYDHHRQPGGSCQSPNPAPVRLTMRDIVQATQRVAPPRAGPPSTYHASSSSSVYATPTHGSAYQSRRGPFYHPSIPGSAHLPAPNAHSSLPATPTQLQGGPTRQFNGRLAAALGTNHLTGGSTGFFGGPPTVDVGLNYGGQPHGTFHGRINGSTAELVQGHGGDPLLMPCMLPPVPQKRKRARNDDNQDGRKKKAKVPSVRYKCGFCSKL